MSARIITVIATIRSKVDCVDAVKSVLLDLTTHAQEDEGCINFDLHQDSRDTARFFFYENWTNESYLERHFQTAHILSTSEALSGLTESIEVYRTYRLS